MLAQKGKLAVVGFLLGLGSPLGWIFLRFAFESPTGFFDWFLSELSRFKALYLYLTLGTTFFFSVFGYAVGHLLEKLYSRDQLLEAKNRDYMKIVGFVAHEIRTPLTSIKGRLDLALGGSYGVLGPELAEALQKAQGGCEQISHMISDHLNLARIERGELNVKLKRLDLLAEVVLPVIEEFKGILEVRGMKIDTRSFGRGQKYFTLGDSQWLKVAFRNLFANAVRYGFLNTAIELRCRERAAEWQIEVFNRGYGIPQGYAEKIFQRFEKVPREGEIGNVGTGLGLYIVKEIIEQHGGKIWCESQPGQWASFILTLPKAMQLIENE